MNIWISSIEVRNAPSPLRPSAFWSSLLHGILMDKLPDKIRNYLHSDTVRPMSQWLEPTGDSTFKWHLCVYNKEIEAAVGNLLQIGDTWHCRHLQADFYIASINEKNISLQEYMAGIFTAEQVPDHLILHFKTAASHKVHGEYVLFPTVDLIGRSICRHMITMDENCVLGDEHVLQDILSHTRIVRYHLHSASFSIEGTRIYGYCGQIELSVRGPEALRRLAWMLFGFAEYSGVGIKTALGMGACTVETIERTQRRTTA